MPAKIRLTRHGRRKSPYYHIVIADARAPRDGRFIEIIGSYNPMTKPATIDLDRDKAYEWLLKGAQPTDTVRAILRFKGVLYRKHLMRGVAKGALTEEQAEAKYKEWIDAKEAKVAERFEQTKAEKEAELKERFGIPGQKKRAMPVQTTAEAAAAFTNVEVDTPAPATEEKAEAPAAEKKADAPAAEKKEEAPAVEKKVDAPAAEKKEEAPAVEKKEEAPAAEKKAEAPPAEAKEAEVVNVGAKDPELAKIEAEEAKAEVKETVVEEVKEEAKVDVKETVVEEVKEEAKTEVKETVVEEVKEETKETAKAGAGILGGIAAATGLKGVVDAVSDKMGDAKDAIVEKAGDVKEAVVEKVGDAKEAVADSTDTTEEKVEEATTTTEETKKSGGGILGGLAAATGLTGVVDAVTDKVADAKDAVVDTVGDVKDSLTTGSDNDSATEATEEEGTGILSKAGGLLGGAVAAAAGGLGSVVSGIKDEASLDGSDDSSDTKDDTTEVKDEDAGSGIMKKAGGLLGGIAAATGLSGAVDKIGDMKDKLTGEEE